MPKVLVRFNTKFEEASDQDLKWRVLVDGKEFLASRVRFLVQSETSEDLIEGGILKWHLSGIGDVVWSGSEVTIR